MTEGDLNAVPATTAGAWIPQSTSPSRRHRHQHRRTTRNHTEKTGGWDVPPPVVSPVDGRWIPRICKWRTPQRLATLQHDDENRMSGSTTLTCHPLIVKHNYLVVATHGELALFGPLSSVVNNNKSSSRSSSSSSKITQPTHKLSLDHDATVVAMLILPNTNEADAKTTTILILSVEGHVSQVSLQEKPENGSRLHLEHSSWNTGRCGATCMTLVRSSPSSNSNQQKQPQLSMIIGYTSGYLEAWKIHNQQPQWKGELFHSIRSLAPLMRKKPKSNKREDGENKQGGSTVLQKTEEEGHDYLVVTLQSETRGDRLATASKVEVLNLKELEEAYRSRTESQQHQLQDGVSIMSLYGFMSLPTPGMELVDVMSNPEDSNRRSEHRHRRQQVHVLPSRGTDCAMAINGDTLCGVALSDGTVALLNSIEESCWGIARDVHQLLMSYPVIGCGYIGDKYWVCCLRGGTCYFIPTTYSTRTDTSGGACGGSDDDGTSQQQELSVISYPHDIDTDITSLYVQGFTAGTIMVKESDGDSEEEMLPVLVYAWAGGVIDLYACHLVYPKVVVDGETASEATEESIVIQELIDNGVLEMVLNVIDRRPIAFTDNSQEMQQLQDPMWDKARQEVQQSTSPPTTLEQVEGMKSLRALLLSLARVRI